jgi:hypothetical protein
MASPTGVLREERHASRTADKSDLFRIVPRGVVYLTVSQYDDLRVEPVRGSVRTSRLGRSFERSHIRQGCGWALARPIDRLP